MSFDEIAKLEGPDLDSFLDLVAWMAEHREAVYRVRAVVDGGTLKLKVGERTWTPPMGRLDPECEAAQDVMTRTRLANGGRGAVDVEPGRFSQAAAGLDITDRWYPRD